MLKNFRENKGLSALLGSALVMGSTLGCSKEDANTDYAGKSRIITPETKSPANADIKTIIHTTGVAGETGQAGSKYNENTRPSPSINVKGTDVSSGNSSTFRFSTFKVPSDGILVEKKSEGDDKESVIYILDYHNNSRDVGAFQRNVQTEIFRIVESIVLERGKVPVAMETWKIGDTADNYVFKTSDSELLETLFSKSSLDARLELVPAVMRDTKFAGPVIAGTFRDSVLPVGTMSEAERQSANELVRTDRSLRKAITGETHFCTGTDGNNYTFYQARDAFRAGGSDVTDHCYCAVSEFEERFLDKFRARMTAVPVKEVSYAIDAPGNFSVVIAGLKHWPAAKEELERRGVNYVAVAPKTLARGVEEKLREEPVKVFYPDNEARTCEKMMTERRALVEAAMGRI